MVQTIQIQIGTSFSIINMNSIHRQVQCWAGEKRMNRGKDHRRFIKTFIENASNKKANKRWKLINSGDIVFFTMLRLFLKIYFVSRSTQPGYTQIIFWNKIICSKRKVFSDGRPSSPIFSITSPTLFDGLYPSDNLKNYLIVTKL